MLHLPEEKKIEQKENKEQIVTKPHIENKEVQPIKEDEKEVKYNGLHAYDVAFQKTDKTRFRVLVIARTVTAAKNRVKEMEDVEEVLLVTCYQDKTSKMLVEKEKKAGVYMSYLKKYY